jgi:hypothetical protein
MADSLMSAAVEMRADFNKFQQDIRKAKTGVGKQAAGLGKEAGRQFGGAFSTGIKGALAGLISVAALKGLLSKTQEVIKSFDEIAKTADSIGIATDALQELRVAADLSRFARAASEAAQGTAQYADSFKFLGVEVKAANGALKPIDQLVGEVADGFAGLTNATEKAALAQELFGRGGVPLVNLLNEGSAGIAKMRQEARDLGIVIEERLLRQAEDLNDRLTLIQKTIDADLSRALFNLGPLLVDVSGAFATFAQSIGTAYAALREFIKGSVETVIFSQQSAAIDKQREKIAGLREEINSLIQTSKTGGRAGVSNVTPTDADLQRAGALTLQLEAEQAELIKLNAEYGRLEKFVNGEGAPAITVKPPELPGEGPTRSRGGAGTEKETEAQKAATKAADDRAAAYERLKEQLESNISTETQETEIVNAKIASIDQEQSAREELIAQIKVEQEIEEVLLAAREAGLEIDQEKIDKLRELAATYGEVSKANRDAQAEEERLNQQKQLATETNQRYADAIETAGDALIREAIAGGDLKPILADLVVQLIELTLRQSLLGGQSAGAQAGAGGAGGIVSSVFSAVAGAFGFGFEKGGEVPGYAEGGDIAKTGGMTKGRRKEIAGVVHGGEFVIRKGPAQAYKDVLEKINAGKRVEGFATGGSVGNLTGFSQLAVDATKGFSPDASAPEQTFGAAGLQDVLKEVDQGRGGKPPVTVNVEVKAMDASSFRRSGSLIASEIGGAIRRGQARQT